MQMNDPDLEHYVRRLERIGVQGIDAYEAKLHSNRLNQRVLLDLIVEGNVAWVLAKAAFRVTLRDRPDLRVDFGDFTFFAEVKHFRRKTQDDIDDARLRGSGIRLVQYGDTRATEGVAAVDQLVSVANRKARQCSIDHATILAIQSSSANCIEETEVDDAAQQLREEAATDVRGSVARLAGILFLSASRNCARQKNVYFYTVADLLPKRIVSMLDDIQEWTG